MSTYTIILQTIASLTGIATSTSMIIAYRQLRLASRNSQASFEDNLAREYRRILGKLPLKALLGQELDPAALDAALPDFYAYFDLTNEQLMLRAQGRVSESTWHVWREGIASNLAKPAFAAAWQRIGNVPDVGLTMIAQFVAHRTVRDPFVPPTRLLPMQWRLRRRTPATRPDAPSSRAKLAA